VSNDPIADVPPTRRVGPGLPSGPRLATGRSAPSSEHDQESKIELTLLGGFGLAVDGEPVDLPVSSQRVLTFLALRERPALRAFVAGHLWSHTTDKRSAASLRSALWRIRRIAGELILATPSHLRLSPRVGVDLRRTLAQANRLLGPPEACTVDDLRLEPLSEDLLPDWYEEWVILEYERVRQLRLYALEVAAERLASLERYGEALQACLTVIRSEPLSERAHRALVKLHLMQGNRGQAVRQYNAFRQLIDRELGTQPSPAMEALLRS
jgi:DNA-binding SARP family transcriptional activator